MATATNQWIRKTENELVAETLVWLATQKHPQLDSTYCIVLGGLFQRADYTVERLKELKYLSARRYVIFACYRGMKYMLPNDYEFETLRKVAATLWEVDHPKPKAAACCVVQ